MNYHTTFAPQLIAELHHLNTLLSSTKAETNQTEYQPQIIEARGIDSNGLKEYTKLIKMYVSRAVNYARKYGNNIATKVEKYLHGLKYRIIPTGGIGLYNDEKRIVTLDSCSIYEDPEWAEEMVGHEVGGHAFHAALGGFKKLIKNYTLKTWATLEAIATKLYEKLSGVLSRSPYKKLRLDKGAEEAEKEVGEYELLNPSDGNVSYVKDLCYRGWIMNLFKMMTARIYSF